MVGKILLRFLVAREMWRFVKGMWGFVKELAKRNSIVGGSS